MILTKAGMAGLQAMAASASAGGPADLGMAEAGKAADRAWAGVQAAIAWALGLLRPGRQIVLVLSPAEAEALGRAAGEGWTGICGALRSDAEVEAGRRALEKLQAAIDSFGAEQGR